MHTRFVLVTAGSALILALIIGAPIALAQAQTSGQWTTLPYPMPINPVHVSLLHTGKVLIVSGSGNVANNTSFKAAIWDPRAGTITVQNVSWDMWVYGTAANLFLGAPNNTTRSMV